MLSIFWKDATAQTKALLGAILFLAVAFAVLTALGPVALKRLVDALSGQAHAARPEMYALIAFYVASQWLSRSVGEARGLLYARVERRMFRALSERVFAHLLHLPMRFHADCRIGAITQTLDNGLQGYQVIMHHLVFTFMPVLAELGTIVVVLSRLGHTAFLVLFIAALICYAAAFTYAAVAVIAPAERASAATLDSTAAIADPLLSVETVKHFAAEDAMQERVSKALLRSENEWVGFFRRYAYHGISVASVFALFLATTVTYSVHEVQLGRMTMGEFVLINTYMLQVVRPVEMMGYAMQGLSHGRGMLKKMLALLAESPELYLPDDERRLPGPGRLEFKHVTTSYRPGQPVLKDVTFSIEAGNTLGIVGASGSGKSTVARLLVRTHEFESGRVMLDGVPIDSLPLTKLRRAIAMVSQDTSLLDDSVASNISLGRPAATRAEIERAARAARLHDFILTLPERYDTRVGERGAKLSGGERQRLAIARAILKDPLVFVFDEATSALDSRNERAILKNIVELSRTRTTVIIAHRLSTVVHADQILVLDAGEIVERGAHAELIQQDGKYAALWRAQHVAKPHPRAATSD